MYNETRGLVNSTVMPLNNLTRNTNMKSMKSTTLFLTAFFLFANITYSVAETNIAPIGEWAIEKKHSSGATIRVEMSITENNIFSGVMLVNGVTNWTYGGIWELNNNEFIYTYKESSKPLPENYQDTDVIISVTKEKYVSKSKLSGEINTYHKIY